ncbi:MAG: DNA-formamidopyrimidine glycosylase family protein, partial [Solirubrobacterales bacterium]
MPELPEVETVRRQLDPEVSGRGVESVVILDHYFTKPHDPR